MDNAARLETYIDEIPPVAWDLIEVSDKPLTIIFSKAKNLAPGLLAGDHSMGVRISREEFSRKLCERFKKPIVSTSANISGEPFPSCFDEIVEEIRKGVDYVVRYRQDDRSEAQPSSIIKLGAGGQVRIIR
jgi:L-threonylcarbamoyladenylate synthase